MNLMRAHQIIGVLFCSKSLKCPQPVAPDCVHRITARTPEIERRELTARNSPTSFGKRERDSVRTRRIRNQSHATFSLLYQRSHIRFDYASRNQECQIPYRLSLRQDAEPGPEPASDGRLACLDETPCAVRGVRRQWYVQPEGWSAGRYYH